MLQITKECRDRNRRGGNKKDEGASCQSPTDRKWQLNKQLEVLKVALTFRHGISYILQIRSIDLWRWHINITITILDIIHHPVLYRKHGISETGFSLRLQEEPTQVGPLERASLCLRLMTENVKNRDSHMGKSPLKLGVPLYKLCGLSPWANYTYRATAACRRSDCQLLRIKGATWSAWRIPPAVFSVF
jgi:hypothetical protein